MIVSWLRPAAFLIYHVRQPSSKFLRIASWRTCTRYLVAEISSIKSIDVVVTGPSVKTILFQDAAFPVRRDQKLAEARIRVVARPERPVAELLARLDLELPTRTKIIQQVETSTFQIPEQTVPESKM